MTSLDIPSAIADRTSRRSQARARSWTRSIRGKPLGDDAPHHPTAPLLARESPASASALV